MKSVRTLPIVVGTMFEWYDLTVYAFFATTISIQFFAPGNEQAAILSTAAAFGVAFLMRPAGAIAFGLIGDRLGRKSALTLSFALMAIATAMIAMAPTYAQAGLFATVVLVLGRLLQGFAASGEVGASVAILLEASPPNRQATSTGWLNVGLYLALALGSVSSLAVHSLLSPEDVQSWGWRLPFMLGLLIAPVGLYVRWHMGESPEFLEVKQPAARLLAPVHSLRGNVLGVVRLIGLGGFGSPVVYLVLIFMPSYAKRELNMPADLPSLSTMIACLVLVAMLVPMGRLCDRVGSKLTLTVSCAIGTALTIPLMVNLIDAPSLRSLLAVQCTLSVFLAAYIVACGPVAISLFPVAQRAMGIGLGYNLGVVTFGAFAPFVTAWLAVAIDAKMVIGWYVFGGGLISLLTALTLPKSVPPAIQIESLDFAER
jgi:MHS family proline/betaine transporter-like MFS transporter